VLCHEASLDRLREHWTHVALQKGDQNGDGGN